MGIVTTTQVTDATPAAFAAHTSSRANQADIAAQLASAGLRVLLGGGEDQFLPVTETGPWPGVGKRLDGRNLVTEARAAGAVVVQDAASLLAAPVSSSVLLLGLFADEGLSGASAPSLRDLTRKAIGWLSAEGKGFFLVVEGGQIDWEAHANNASGVIDNV
ncbi:MAG: alkaline phosphatase, partial [Candidatus Riflebacteria bacterium]|nr:alkaline phosphatase [Candidatus Riflebacteria bacterium]